MSIGRSKLVVFLFLFPAMAVYSFFAVIPIFGSFYLSLFKWTGLAGAKPKLIWLDNFLDLLTYPPFWTSISNIVWFTVLTILTQLPIGLLLALLLTDSIKGYKFFKASYFMPQVVSGTAVSVLWGFILRPLDGVLNTCLERIGLAALTHNWLVEKGTAMTSITMVNTWIGIGFHMVLMLAALAGIPKEILEVAMLDGAKGWTRLFKVVLPMIWESIKSSMVIMITASLKAFEIVYVLTQGGPNGLTHVPATLLYNSAFQYFDFGTGSAIAVFIFLLSISTTLFCLKVMQRETVEY